MITNIRIEQVEKININISLSTRDIEIILFKIITTNPYIIFKGIHYDIILESKYIILDSQDNITYNKEILYKLLFTGYNIGFRCIESKSDTKYDFQYKENDTIYKYEILDQLCMYNENQGNLYNKYKVYDILPFYTPVTHMYIKTYPKVEEHIHIGRISLTYGLRIYDHSIYGIGIYPRLRNGILINIPKNILINGFVHVYITNNLDIVTKEQMNDDTILNNGKQYIYDTWIHNAITIEHKNNLIDLISTISKVDGHIPISKYRWYKDVIFV